MSRGTLDPAACTLTSGTGLSPSPAGLSRTVPLSPCMTYAVRTPERTRSGLGSSGFARRYSRNRVFFLFLRLLRCFSSPGSLRDAIDSHHGDGGFLRRVSPFRHLRIDGHLLLPAAFRSLSRLSSAPDAKASAPRLPLLNPILVLRAPLCLAWHAGYALFKFFRPFRNRHPPVHGAVTHRSFFLFLGCLAFDG